MTADLAAAWLAVTVPSDRALAGWAPSSPAWDLFGDWLRAAEAEAARQAGGGHEAH